MSAETTHVGDCTNPRYRFTRLSRGRPEDRSRGEGGFTLIEVVIAISLLVIMLIPFADAYITAISATNGSHMKEVAVMVADSALDQARALNATNAQDSGTALVSGRTEANVETEWGLAVPGTAALLDSTDWAWDTSALASSDSLNLPTTEQSETVGGQTFEYYYFVGNCYEAPYATGVSNNTCSCYQQAPFTSDPSCANAGAPPTGDITMYRVIVAVTWSAAHSGCGSSGCYYVTSSLISGALDPSFDVNPTVPYINSASTDDTPPDEFIEGSAGSFQVTTEGFPPPTYQDVAEGTCTPSGTSWLSISASTGLVTGTPPSGDAGNQYDVCITATNAAGSGYQTLTIIPQKATPIITVNLPASGTLGGTLSASSLGISLSSTAYNDGGTVNLYLYGPGSEPTTCAAAGAIWSYSTTAHGNGTYASATGYTTPMTAGTYWYYASVGSDTNNNTVNTGCDTANMDEVDVPQDQPVLAALTGAPPSPGSASTGTPMSTSSLATTMSSASTSPAVTGTLTFYAFYTTNSTAPSSCSTGSAVWSSGSSTTVASTGNGTYHPSTTSYTPLDPGYYWWYAYYSGDTNNFSANTVCSSAMPYTQITGLAYPSLTNVTGPTSGTLGSNVAASSFKATLGNAYSPNSTITWYYVWSNTVPTSCSGGTAAGATATATTNTTYTGSGTGFAPSHDTEKYWFYAVFSADANNNSACGIDPTSMTVGLASPTLTNVTGPTSGTVGSNVAASSFGATLANAYSPDSTITWYYVISNTAPTSCSGGAAANATATATSNTTYTGSGTGLTLGGGEHWFYAVFSADADNNSACGIDPLPVNVLLANPTLTNVTGPTSGTVGSNVAASSFKATLGNAYSPNSTITWYYVWSNTVPTSCSGGTAAGATATATTNTTYTGSGTGFAPSHDTEKYWFYAVFSADANNNSACGIDPSSMTVGLASPTLTNVTGPTSGTLGSNVAASSFKATLGNAYSPNSTITWYYVWSNTVPTSCSGGTAAGATATATTNTTYTGSGTGFAPSHDTEKYWFYAVFSADANNNSACGIDPSSMTVSA